VWIFYLLSYLMLAGVVAAFICFPSWRGRAARAGQAWSMGLRPRMPRWDWRAPWRRWSGRSQAAGSLLRRRPWHASGAALVLLAPVLLAMLGRPDARLPEKVFDDPAAQQRILLMLAGDQLVPPLPQPALFTTPEIQAEQPQLVAASRDWKQLKPAFVKRLLVVFKLMSEQGYEMTILEGYRSRERQAELARMGPHVTRAGPGQSWHQHGLAADCAFIRDGKLVISEKDPWAMRGYQLYGQAAQAAGLVWGGNWAMRDFGHAELPEHSLKDG
jgi:peptidoglycan L-alanyl-D-glutamate endopeptidase CwlK